MAIAKFSKQLIQPNPIEVDYWIDIASNPYGGIIKYYNGDDWVQFDFYTTKEMDELLAGKADIEMLDTKVNHSDLAELVKKIELKGSNDNVQLVYLTYDRTSIAVTLPIASDESAGILTAEGFKSFVKEHQLEELHTYLESKISEFDSTIAEIHERSTLALDTAQEFAELAQDAKTTAEAAKNAIATLEGLADADTSAITAAEVITKVEQNASDIQYMKDSEVLLPLSVFEELSTKDPTKKYYIYEDE